MRNLITLADLHDDELRSIVHLSREIKLRFLRGDREPLLQGHVMALLFEKPSLRTRVSFESLMAHLGGVTINLDNNAGWGHREPLQDFVRVLSSYVDIIVARTKEHSTVEQIAEYASCSVINGLTDHCHPCQAVADLLTAFEQFGSFDFVKVAYVGDANNVARSLATACASLNLDFSIGCPQQYQFAAEEISRLNASTSATIRQVDDAAEAVDGATVVYSDVWASMGQESEQQQRLVDFQPFQVNQQLMDQAHRDAIFLHCLPAKRGGSYGDNTFYCNAMLAQNYAYVLVRGALGFRIVADRTLQKKTNSPRPSTASTSQSQLKGLGFAMHKYHDTHRAFPGSNSTSRSNRQVVTSWREQLLPFLDERPLYHQIAQAYTNSAGDEDIPKEVPLCYASSTLTEGQRKAGLTTFLAPVGEGTLMSLPSPRLRDVTDGTSNTIMLIEVPPEFAVSWRSKEDLHIDMNAPVREIRKFPGTHFNALMCDGSVRQIPTNIDAEVFRRLLIHDDKAAVDWDAIERNGGNN